MDSELGGKVLLVTGAAGGIGSAIAGGFAEEGARLVLHYRSNRAGAAALGGELKGAEPLMVRADLTREPEGKQLFAAAVKRFGRGDVLVANAGAGQTRDGPLEEIALKQ